MGFSNTEPESSICGKCQKTHTFVVVEFLRYAGYVFHELHVVERLKDDAVSVSQCLARATSDGAPSQMQNRRNVRPCCSLSTQSPSVRPSAASVVGPSTAAFKNYRYDFECT